jgi:hypothetical protein
LIWLGLAWLGLAWLGLAWLGLAWLCYPRQLPMLPGNLVTDNRLARNIPRKFDKMYVLKKYEQIKYKPSAHTETNFN